MIFFIYGQDAYRSRLKKNQLIDKFITEVDPSQMNLEIIDGSSMSYEDFESKASASGFMAKRRMIVINNVICKNKNKKIQNALNSYVDSAVTDNIIIFFEENTSDDQSYKKFLTAPLTKKLKQEKYAQEFPLLKGGALDKWIDNEVQAQNGVFEKGVTRYLSANIGPDLWSMHLEIEKLLLHAHGRNVTIEDAHKLVRHSFDDNIFNLMDAITAHNTKKACTLLDGQLALGVNEMYILSMLTRQYRIMCQLKNLYEKKQASAQVYAKELGLHPFVVQKMLPFIRKYSVEELKNIYTNMMRVDIGIKLGIAKPRFLLSWLLLSGFKSTIKLTY